jgi:leucyl aminopeptidase
LDKSAIQKEKMNLLLGVNRGSIYEPRFVVASFLNNKHSDKVIALVGKGITFDSGGYALKPTDRALTMRMDKAGACDVMAIMYAIAKLNLKINLICVAPLTDNLLSEKSMLPGEVLASRNGKTVFISNPDAEGRLVLADAIDYVIDKFHPSILIDIATLTGSIVASLGKYMTGVFTNNYSLAEKFKTFSDEVGDET